MQIWKFPLAMTDVQELQMPEGALMLCVQVQRNVPCLWALCDETAPKRPRGISIYGTGHPVSAAPKTYIGTFQIAGGDLVFHAFDLGG